MTRKKLVPDQIILCIVQLMIMSLVSSRLAPFDNFSEISYAYTVDQKFLSVSGLLLINFITSSSGRAVLKYSDGTMTHLPNWHSIRTLGHRALPGANTPLLH